MVITTTRPPKIIKPVIPAPTFRDLATMTHEQLTDPDYALKQIVKLSGGKLSVTCSKCHHCRR